MSELETPRSSPEMTEDDPIGRLHKMSTTAGVASSDYVAINSLAIASIILGLVAAMAFVHPFFVLVGAVGVICGVIAIVQIRGSNGTQGGMLLAVLGILISVGFAGLTGARQVAEARRQKAQTQEIGQLIRDLGRHVIAGDYTSAYALFSPVFQQKVSPAQFEQVWKLQQDPQYTGRLSRMEPNDIVDYTRYESGVLGDTLAIVKYEKLGAESRMVVSARNDDGAGWKLSYLEIFEKVIRQADAPKATFGPAGPPAPGGAAPPGAGPR
jgi:type II secretory pathway pseudopilin PulG